MDENESAGGYCNWIWCIGLLFKRIQAIGCAFWAHFLTPESGRRLAHLPHSPPLQTTSSLVAPGLEGQSTSTISETIDSEVALQVKVGRSSIPQYPNPDLGLRSIVPPELQQLPHPPSSCSETKNSQVILEPEAKHLVHPLSTPVHASADALPAGSENYLGATTKPTDFDVVSQPEVSMVPLPFREVVESGFPTGPGVEEQGVSSCTETTSSNAVSEPEIIGDGIGRGLQEVMIGGQFSEIFVSDILYESDSGQWYAIHRPLEALNTSDMETTPQLDGITAGSSEFSSDSDILTDPKGSAIFYESHNTVPLEGTEIAPHLDQTEIWCTYSEVLSEEEGVTVALNSSTDVVGEEELQFGALADGVVFQKLNPNATEFIPGASNSGKFLVPRKESDLRQRLEVHGEKLTLSWIEGKAYSPRFSAPSYSAVLGVGTSGSWIEEKASSPRLSAPSHPVALGVGTSGRMDSDRMAKWNEGKDFFPHSVSEVVLPESGHGTGMSGPVEAPKVPHGKNNSQRQRRKKGNPQANCPYYPPSDPKRTVKYSHEKA